jgi:hypothetical protein
MKVKAEDTFADLYRPGYLPFREMGEHSLVRVRGLEDRSIWSCGWNRFVEGG